MKSIQGKKLEVKRLERHTHICDLIHFEGPLLSLFSDRKTNWLYHWADTDSAQKNRWILFSVERENLVQYLKKETSLLNLINCTNSLWVLDESHKVASDVAILKRRDSYRSLIEISHPAQLSEYLPLEDSYFDESLTNDVSMETEMNPESFSIPIDGRWFFSDLDRFSKSYSHVYAFLYATRPQFITNISDRLGRFMRSPWTGGYSRLNLFTALEQVIPALHGLQIKKIEYASPGKITIEALRSVGEDIKMLTLKCATNSLAIKEATKKINQTLADSNLRRRNLSKLTDALVPLDIPKLKLLKEYCAEIANLLSLEAGIDLLREQSPNTIVFSKAVLAIVKQIDRLADFQNQGLLDLDRTL